MECINTSTFSLSFVGRFVLLRSVLLLEVSLYPLLLFRQPTAEEEAAARIITSHLRLVGKSRLEKSMIPDNPIHQETLEALVQSVPLLESNEEKLGVAMLQ